VDPDIERTSAPLSVAAMSSTPLLATRLDRAMLPELDSASAPPWSIEVAPV